MGIEDIIQKHGYNEDIANYLRRAYPYFVKEFGDEQTIYNALISTPIYLTDNIYKCLKEHGFINREDNEMVSFDRLKASKGVYHSEPIIKYNKGLNTYSLEGVNRIIAVNGNTLLEDKTKSMLTHEISHLIKSYKGEYTIKADTIVERSGLIERIYILHEEDGNVISKIYKETGVELEEALNTLSEDTIMTKVKGQPFYANGYRTMKTFIQLIINGYKIPNLKEIFKEAEMYHDNTRLEQVLGSTYYELRDFADKLYPLEVEKLSFNTTNKRRLEIQNEMQELFQNEFTPIEEKLKSIGQSSIKM